MDMTTMATTEIRALMDTCHRLHEYDSWFDALAREYRSRADRTPFHCPVCEDSACETNSLECGK